MAFQHHNLPSDVKAEGSLLTNLPPNFTIKASPGTDMWRKPPSLDAFDAPICYRAIKLSSFRRARVTISADWKALFDQGGLCLILPRHAQDEVEASTRKWIKTGIELYNGSPHVSTVACDRWADWSLWPLDGNEATIEMERELVDSRLTSTLWVYLVKGNERKPIREVTWVFHPEGDGEDNDCWVGLYAAKPTKDGGDEDRQLEVVFDWFHVETA